MTRFEVEPGFMGFDYDENFGGFGSSLRDVGRVFLCSSNRKHSEGCEVLIFHGKHL